MIPVVVTILVVAVLALMLVGMAIGVYNRLVRLRNRYENGFSQIEVQLKRRYDLIPNLVETAKGYLKHERETLEAVIKARNQAVGDLQQAAANPGDAQALQGLMGAERNLSGALGRLMVVVERYPELKANENMMQLSEELTSTENKIAFARQAFNDAVTAYNTYRQSFPPIAFAGLFGHSTDAVLLDFDDTAITEPPKISF